MFTKVASIDKIELICMAVVFFLLSSVVFCKLSSLSFKEDIEDEEPWAPQDIRGAVS